MGCRRSKDEEPLKPLPAIEGNCREARFAPCRPACCVPIPRPGPLWRGGERLATPAVPCRLFVFLIPPWAEVQRWPALRCRHGGIASSDGAGPKKIRNPPPTFFFWPNTIHDVGRFPPSASRPRCAAVGRCAFKTIRAARRDGWPWVGEKLLRQVVPPAGSLMRLWVRAQLPGNQCAFAISEYLGLDAQAKDAPPVAPPAACQLVFQELPAPPSIRA